MFLGQPKVLLVVFTPGVGLITPLVVVGTPGIGASTLPTRFGTISTCDCGLSLPLALFPLALAWFLRLHVSPSY